MPLGILEQQCRTACTQGAVTDFGHFQSWIDLGADANQVAALFQLSDKIAQIPIFHVSP